LASSHGSVITSTAVVIAAIIGIHSLVEPSPSAGAAPTVTITQTVTVAPPNSSNPKPGKGANPPSTNGSLLGSYEVTMPDGYYFPIGPKAPLPSQLSTTGGGDLIYSTLSGVTSLAAVPSQSTMAGLSPGVVPTYQRCLRDTDLVQAVSAGQGTTFCLTETAGRMVGGTVIYIDPNAINPASVMVKVIVWQNKS
jgi:hypothetical protein